MSMFPQLDQQDSKELRNLFLGDSAVEAPEDEQELWLQEVALLIAQTGPKGVEFLLSRVPGADEPRLLAIFLALTLVEKNLSSHQRTTLCDLARRFLTDDRALVVAEAVDTLSRLQCSAVTESVSSLLTHPSPYVVGSALRFFAHREPEKAVPLLEKALTAEEPIVRENAVDELDEMNYTPALAQIKQLLQDPDDDVRQAARSAVAHLEKASS